MKPHESFISCADITSARIITLDEFVSLLKPFFTYHKNSASDMFELGNKTLNWQALFHDNHYHLNFSHISLYSIAGELLTSLGYTKIIAPQEILFSGVFDGFIFQGKNIPFFHQATFKNCQFNDCQFSFLNLTHYGNCSFNRVLFLSSTLADASFEDSLIQDCQFIDSTLENLTFKNTSLLSCEFKKTNFIRLVGLSAADFVKNTIDLNCFFHGTAWDISFFHAQTSKQQPLVILLYALNDGVRYTEVLRVFFTHKGLTLICIDPEQGLRHPIFTSDQNIQGIILPGGPHLPSEPDKDIRTQFEISLIKLAIQEKIPLLGICRGHQIIGAYYGGQVKTIHNHERSDIHVKDKTSQLYQRLEKKYLKIEGKQEARSFSPMSLKRNAETFIYTSRCAHEQALFFKSIPEEVKIVAKASDGIIEALEIGETIQTFQHHNEASLEEFSEETQINKSILNIFCHKVMKQAPPAITKARHLSKL
jgi:gamma-glutamyl-gamma-aminobutyrate hydrolase PuuD/uncharacterized protein YjbI with pentapeptide repeats